ncbi:MAG: type II secretion system protein M [Bdellovibrionales bacterium]|nr:type II secretion system protein M [Oligoflexia bacterium]
MSFAAQLDKVKEQEWFQQLKSSYDQLSPEQQSYAKWGSLLLGSIVFMFVTISTIQSANTAKGEYFEKQELVRIVSQATDEIRRLKGQNAGFVQAGVQNWKSILQSAASQQGMAAEAVEITKESPGASQNVIQETLLEVQVKGASVRPLTQFLVQLERGNPPIKLKGMKIETAGDGSLNAHLNLSGYLSKPEKAERK